MVDIKKEIIPCYNKFEKKKQKDGFYERKNLVTLFGEITFKRQYYYDTTSNEYFFFTDLFLGLQKEIILIHLPVLKYVNKLLLKVILKLEK